MEYALDQPSGLRGMVVADSPASMTLWVSEANRLRRDLPADVQETLARHEDDGTTSDPEYEAAVRVFYDRHLCRVPWPDCVQRSFDQIAADPTVYHTMNGPSEFHVVGTLLNRAWVNADMTQYQRNVQTALVPAGGGGVFDVQIDQPGLYPVVSHSFASVDEGQVGLLNVGHTAGTMSH